MKTSAVYRIESKEFPDRIYIGSSSDVSDRWRCHLKDLRNNRHHSAKLQNHYNKYGEEDLIFIIIEPCLPQFLLVREQSYLDECDCYFNILPIAGSCIGVKRSEETKRKVSESKKGHKMSDEFRRKRSEYMKGNKLNKGKHWKWTEEQKDKWLRGDRNPFFGKHHKKESIEKGNVLRRQYRASDETKRKMSEALKGRKHSPEAIEKMRLAKIGKKRGKYKKSA